MLPCILIHNEAITLIPSILFSLYSLVVQVIEAIASAIGSTDGVNLLDVDPGLSTNRTVYTFVGSPGAVVEGALNGARAAMALIDMRQHKGMGFLNPEKNTNLSI